MTRARLPRWPPSRIGLRLLAFNLLVVFVPVIGVLYLDVYEDRLLRAQEREMVQQGRVLAAAIAGNGRLDASSVNAILTRLDRQTDARFRVYDASGSLLADSARVAVRQLQPPEQPYGSNASRGPSDIRRRTLYRIGAWIARIREGAGNAIGAALRWNSIHPQASPGDRNVDPELRAALAGQYGAATRRTPGQRSLTLFSAVPVRDAGAIVGAVVVSQSTFRVLQALYDVRLRIFEVVVASVFAAAILTTLATMTIVRPLRRLRGQALALADRRGPLPGSFPGTTRTDELGDLARALEELTRRLHEQIGRLEGFAGDVSHEFKNPLASIRTAAETIRDSERPEDRDRFLALLLRDVDRLERLVSGVRDLARVDGQLELEAASAVRLADVLHQASAAASSIGPDRSIAIDAAASGIVVRGSPERLGQVFENVLSNAVSFSPPGSPIDVEVRGTRDRCTVTISDRGPGIPPGHDERIFERFFTYRPVSGRGDHVGLGLAIARRIVEGYGGTITARNREGGGASFEVTLRVAADRSAADQV